MTIPAIYCINLKDSIGRKERMVQRLEHHNLVNNTKFIEAISRDSPMIDYFHQNSVQEYPDTRKWRSEMACFASHLKAIRTFLEDGGDECLICEDDIMFDNDFKNKYIILRSNFLPNSKIIGLSYMITHWDGFKYSGIDPTKKNLYSINTENTWGMQLYWISKDYAITVLTNYYKPYNLMKCIHTSEVILRIPDAHIAVPPLAIEECIDSERAPEDMSYHEKHFSQWGISNYSSAEENKIIELDGYKFYRHLDFPHNDIYYSANKTIMELKEFCDKNNNCIGFNTYGYFKSHIFDVSALQPMNKIKHNNDGIYINLKKYKENKEIYDNNLKIVRNFTGYVFYKQLDSVGNNIKYIPGRTIEELKTICDNNETCMAFNTSGHLKYSVCDKDKLTKISTDNNINTGLYVNIERYKKQLEIEEENNKHVDFEGYTFYKQLDSMGNDLVFAPNKTKHELKQLCDNDEKCIGFNTKGYLKYFVAPKLVKINWFNEFDGLYVNNDRYKKFNSNKI